MISISYQEIYYYFFSCILINAVNKKSNEERKYNFRCTLNISFNSLTFPVRIKRLLCELSESHVTWTEVSRADNTENVNLYSQCNLFSIPFLSMQLSLDRINEKHLVPINEFFFHGFLFLFFNFSWILFYKLRIYKMIIERKTWKLKEENSVNSNKF